MRNNRMLKRLEPGVHGLLALCMGALPLLLAPAATAQDLDVYSEVKVEYNDNIFRLTKSQQSRLEDSVSEDSKSGRFDHMESISDDILSPTLGIKYKSSGIGGGDLTLSGRVEYNYHLENQEKNYPEARIQLKNDIGEKGKLVLEGNFLFDFFRKNYLAGYDDENDNGNISREERIYSPGIYNEYEGILAYEYMLFKKKESVLSRAELKPFLGVSTRDFNSPFHNRDRDVAFGGLELTFRLISKIDLGLLYQYENTRYPGNDERVLFDETRLGTDMNADGEIKENAPLVTAVDRSAKRHTLEINPSFKITKDILFFLGYERRTSDYASDNPLDTDHYHNTSHRQRIKGGIQYDVSKSWSAQFEYRRTNDEDPEDGDYSENRLAFSIRYNLP